MKEYSVYVLISHKDHKHYKGLSKNIPKRLSEHNSGKVRSTKSRRPFSLIYSERIGKFSEARKREKFLKSSTGRRFLAEVLTNSSTPDRGSLPD